MPDKIEVQRHVYLVLINHRDEFPPYVDLHSLAHHIGIIHWSELHELEDYLMSPYISLSKRAKASLEYVAAEMWPYLNKD